MRRERVLKVVLLLVGLLFCAGVYPLIGSLLHPADSDTGDTMMLSLYVALGIFLLIAVRNPSQPHRLRGVVKLCSRGHDVDTRTRNRESARGISGRIGCPCSHRLCTDHTGSANRFKTLGELVYEIHLLVWDYNRAGPCSRPPLLFAERYQKLAKKCPKFGVIDKRTAVPGLLRYR